MHNRNLRGGRRRGYRTRSRRTRRPGPGIIALGLAIPVLVVGYFLAAQGPEHAVSAADVQGPIPSTTALAGASGASNVGGWGKGGYPMVTGTASGAGSNGAGSNGAGSNGAGSNGAGSNGAGSNGETANAPDGGTANVTDVTSENWAGYAATGAAGSLTSVSSSWAEPAVTCGATDTFSSFWVGLDGDGTATVEQTGTEADCAGGAASYQGWYEIFPNAPVFFSNPVQPGDAMSASVVSDGDGLFTLTLADGTAGWTQTTQQAEPDAQLGSAEVIAEAPSNGTVLPLADFGTVNFTSAAVDNAPIGDSANLSELTMDAVSGGALATPSALAGGNAFSITSDSDGAVTTAPSTGGGGGNGGGGVGGGSGGTGGSGGSGGGSGGGGGLGRHHHHWGF